MGRRYTSTREKKEAEGPKEGTRQKRTKKRGSQGVTLQRLRGLKGGPKMGENERGHEIKKSMGGPGGGQKKKGGGGTKKQLKWEKRYGPVTSCKRKWGGGWKKRGVKAGKMGPPREH